MEPEIHTLEQIAYGAVLRAFKAQSDALSWDKESLITELRKELRVSDDEHRELLTEVNADDLIRRIREWREAGGSHNLVSQHVGIQLPSPSVSAPRKRHKVPLSGLSFGTQTPVLPQPGVGIQPPSLSGKRGPASTAGRRPNAGQATSLGKPPQHPFSDHVTSEGARDSFIGRRVMIRWHEDNNFYEALITDYNSSDGRHALVYDSNTPDATVEWVNFKEFHPDDIRWVGDNPVMSRVGEGGGLNSDDCEEIEILNTDILIQKVENLLEASPPNVLEIAKAKKLLKEHEHSLMEVIKKLAKVTATQGVDNEHY